MKTTQDLIQKVPTQLLEEELERRSKADPPKQVSDPDLTDLRKVCKHYIQSIAEQKGYDEDMEHYVFEAAVLAIYGPDIWEWINKRV